MSGPHLLFGFQHFIALCVLPIKPVFINLVHQFPVTSVFNFHFIFKHKCHSNYIIILIKKYCKVYFNRKINISARKSLNLMKNNPINVLFLAKYFLKSTKKKKKWCHYLNPKLLQLDMFDTSWEKIWTQQTLKALQNTAEYTN